MDNMDAGRMPRLLQEQTSRLDGRRNIKKTKFNLETVSDWTEDKIKKTKFNSETSVRLDGRRKIRKTKQEST